MLALVSRLDALMMVGFATFSQLYDIDVQDCRTTKSRRKHIHLLFPISHLVSDLLTLALEKSNKLGKGCQTWSACGAWNLRLSKRPGTSAVVNSFAQPRRKVQNSLLWPFRSQIRHGMHSARHLLLK